MIKLKKIEKIFSNKGNIFRIVDQKKLYPVKEVYITTIKYKSTKNWRKHMNCDTVLVCLKGTVIVETKRLNEQVKRNLLRFPEDFMFQLTVDEHENLKSQNATSSWGGRRKAPFVFTEHGVLMLSSVLNSEKAIEINIQIVRIFTKMREMLLTHKDILLQLEEMKKSINGQEDRVDLIYNYLTQFIKEQKIPRKEVGYKK